MSEIDVNNEHLVLRVVRKTHLQAILYAVLPLFLLAWWKRGFWVALIASAALYAFLAFMIYAQGWFGRVAKKRRQD